MVNENIANFSVTTHSFSGCCKWMPHCRAARRAGLHGRHAINFREFLAGGSGGQNFLLFRLSELLRILQHRYGCQTGKKHVNIMSDPRRGRLPADEGDDDLERLQVGICTMTVKQHIR